ncbi:hypothetical protein L873DRAFT_1852785 [Choiromyces venosus 120613-1]|uniref:Uncharacterized protein n=1 Tax=Choiromyces venosus 120613-1 TaxID=1336337 RepID=A0A3N4J923_9PEZI|nr:hypothetical protein L873DRAFT_1852785 [Choiromyces venosus 120613-1]
MVVSEVATNTKAELKYGTQPARPVTLPLYVDPEQAKAQNLRPQLNVLPVKIPNDNLEPDTYGFPTAHESRQDHIEATAIADDDEEDKQKYVNDNLSSLDSVASSYVQRLSAHVAGLAAKCSAPGRSPQAPHRHRRRQQSSPEYRNQTNVSADSADLASRITDWIPPPPELPLSPTLFDPEIAAAYPLPPSRACSEPTPSTHPPPYQLPPYPAGPRSTASSSSLFVRGTKGSKLRQLKASPSSVSSATTDLTWGPDSPLTAALRMKRAAAISSPALSVSSQGSDSSGLTDVEEELRAVEEAGRKEVIRQRVLLSRLIAERDGDRDGELEFGSTH